MVQDQPRRARTKKTGANQRKNRLDQQRPRQAVALEDLFAGAKAKWLPLYRRLLARVSGIPGIEFVRGQTSIAVSLTGVASSEMALIKVLVSGLDFRFALPKAQLRSPRLKKLSARTRPTMTHQVLLSETSDLDEEFLTWLKAAKTEARTSKGRSS